MGRTRFLLSTQLATGQAPGMHTRMCSVRVCACVSVYMYVCVCLYVYVCVGGWIQWRVCRSSTCACPRTVRRFKIHSGMYASGGANSAGVSLQTLASARDAMPRPEWPFGLWLLDLLALSWFVAYLPCFGYLIRREDRRQHFECKCIEK
jgi:hypothetical protein